MTTDFGWISDLGTALAIQSDGKIVVVGYTDSSGDGTDHNIIVARYTASGVLDTDFDSDGMLVAAIGSGHDRAAAVAIQSDGKIVVAGSSDNGTDLDIAVMRFTPE